MRGQAGFRTEEAQEPDGAYQERDPMGLIWRKYHCFRQLESFGQVFMCGGKGEDGVWKSEKTRTFEASNLGDFRKAKEPLTRWSFFIWFSFFQTLGLKGEKERAKRAVEYREEC